MFRHNGRTKSAVRFANLPDHFNGRAGLFNSPNSLSNIFESAGFYAELTKSLVLNRGTGSPTFTRAATAYATAYGPTANSGDAQTLILCASNEARFSGARRISEGVWSYTFANGTPIPSASLLGYQAEGARTNLCLQSQTLTVNGAGVPWAYGVGYNSTVVADQTAAPDGTTTADVLVDDSGTGTGNVILEQTVTVATSSTYTWSIYAKKKQLQWIRLFLLNFTTPGNGGCYFDLNTGAVGTATAGITGRIEAAANGFYRCSITFTTDAADTSGAIRVYLADADGDPTVDRDGTSDVYLWGSQFELGAFASSYIPTTTIAVARPAEVDSVPTASNILAAASSVYLEFTPTHAPSGTIALWGTYVDANNYTAILHDATNMIMRKRIAGSNYDATIANAFAAGTTYNVCGTWGSAGVSITLDGVEGTPHANTTAAQIAATMQIGADGNSLQQPFASIRNDRIWMRQLSASERLAVTA